jgi:hypothetical protein
LFRFFDEAGDGLRLIGGNADRVDLLTNPGVEEFILLGATRFTRPFVDERDPEFVSPVFSAPFWQALK